jgi:Protein of unknown function (DUF3039)
MSTTPLDSPGLSGGTLLEERTSSTDDGDHEKFAHYVEKDKIVESAVMGSPVKALCGKVWVPNRDPSKRCEAARTDERVERSLSAVDDRHRCSHHAHGV